MFIHNNQQFTCIHCGALVTKHPSSSRDHCNMCLYGLHVDIFPGDRANNCKGMLEPIGIQDKGGKRKIVYRCGKCHKQVVNIAAPDDNSDILLELSTYSW